MMRTPEQQQRYKQTKQKQREDRIAQGICTYCGKAPSLSGKHKCQQCTEKQNAKGKARYDKLRADGFCVKCHNNLSTSSGWYCQDCIDSARKREQSQRDEREANGVCTSCGGRRVHTESLQCEICCLKSLARCHLGSAKHWKALAKKWIDQNKKCPYTGRTLWIGINASIDHIIPTARGGSGELDNLEWVDHEINLMKNNRTKNDVFKVFIHFADDRNKLAPAIQTCTPLLPARVFGRL